MNTVVLPEALTIESVVPIRTALLDALANDAVLGLDARAVEDIDGAGIQLLLSAIKEAALRKASVILSPSPALLATLEMLAVADRFEMHAADLDVVAEAEVAA